MYFLSQMMQNLKVRVQKKKVLRGKKSNGTDIPLSYRLVIKKLGWIR